MWFSPLKSPDLILIVPIHDFCCWGKQKSRPKSKNPRCSRVSPEASWLWKLLLVWLPWSQGEQEGMFGGGSVSQGSAKLRWVFNLQPSGFARAGTYQGLLDWPPNLALSALALVKSSIKTGLVILHPGGSAETFWPFLEFPKVEAGCEKSWMERGFHSHSCSSAGPAGVGHFLGVSKNPEVVDKWSPPIDCCLSIQTQWGISDSMAFSLLRFLR